MNIPNLKFTGVELQARFKLARSQQIDLNYTGLSGAQQSLADLQSKYVFNYPVNQAFAGWLGRVHGGVQLHARAEVTEHYLADSYPLDGNLRHATIWMGAALRPDHET